MEASPAPLRLSPVVISSSSAASAAGGLMRRDRRRRRAAPAPPPSLAQPWNDDNAYDGDMKSMRGSRSIRTIPS